MTYTAPSASYEQAIADNSRFYYDKCQRCHGDTTPHYTKTRSCRVCTYNDAVRLSHVINHNGDNIELTATMTQCINDYDPTIHDVVPKGCDQGHLGLRYKDGTCVGCGYSPRKQAKLDNKPTYIPVKPCSICGERAPRDTETSRCYGCYPPRKVSPRKQAKLDNKPTYIPVKPCSICGERAPRDTETSRCHGCHPPRKVSPRKQAKLDNKPTYIPVKPCSICGERAPRDTETSRCHGCHPPRKVSPRKQAKLDNKPTYIPVKPCSICGERAPRDTETSRCYGCYPPRGTSSSSARATARKHGDTYYTPETECKHCHTRSPRRTADNFCSGCQPSLNRQTRQRETTGPLYYNGQSCHKCGDTYRYTHNNKCPTCLTAVMPPIEWTQSERMLIEYDIDEGHTRLYKDDKGQLRNTISHGTVDKSVTKV